MKKVVLLALIAAICAGALLYVYLGKLEQQKQVQIVYENVVVAAEDIPAYTSITAEMLTLKQVPEGTAHQLAARAVSDAAGFVTESEHFGRRGIIPAKLSSPARLRAGCPT
jgi:Flp pilus assembly protein CpaB